MAIETVGVVGCGLMGSGITQVCAQAGYRTLVREATDDLVNGGIGRIDSILSRSVSKGRMTVEEKTAVLGRITGTTDFEDLASCDLVIEAVTENLETKQEVFRILDGIVPPEPSWPAIPLPYPSPSWLPRLTGLSRYWACISLTQFL